MLNVVAVQVANYCGRGREYTERLFNGFRRNLRIKFRGLCITDDPDTVPTGVTPILTVPGLTGWWNKLVMFKPGVLPEGERYLFADLDTMVIGDMTEIASYDGPMAVMRDPFYKLHHGSALMVWEGGKFPHIWNNWEAAGKPEFDPQGDQHWIELQQPKVDFLQDLFPGHIVSFKADILPLGGIPPTARFICFHGRPRPHEVNFLIPHKETTDDNDQILQASH